MITTHMNQAAAKKTIMAEVEYAVAASDYTLIERIMGRLRSKDTIFEALLIRAVSEAIDKAGVTELAIAADFAEQHALIRNRMEQSNEEQQWNR